MRESDTYMAIIDEGQEMMVKKNILSLGQKKFGPPEPAITTRLEGDSDLEHLSRILDRILEATSWEDLLNSL